jgi:hypothetical protein
VLWLGRAAAWPPQPAFSSVRNGRLLADWHDARLFAVGAALAYYLARRNDVAGTILVGTGTLMLLRLGFGWP